MFLTLKKKMRKNNHIVKVAPKTTLKKAKKITPKTNLRKIRGVKTCGYVPNTKAQSYQEIAKKCILQHLRTVFSPYYFRQSLTDYAQMFPGEDIESVCLMVIEDIKKEAEKLIKQIQSLRF